MGDSEQASGRCLLHAAACRKMISEKTLALSSVNTSVCDCAACDGTSLEAANDFC